MFLNQEDKIAPLRISDNGSTALYPDTSNPKGNCNWLGPFCHLHLPSGWADNVSCCAWKGVEIVINTRISILCIDL